MIEGKKRIVVAMSGGVDSSVAAALLAEAGHEVIGITLRLWTPSPWSQGERYGGCCSPADFADAKKVCQKLNVPHYSFDLEQKFKETVVDNFIREYLDGSTPNPCVRCNGFIKFGILLKYAMTFNADYLATGHYARIVGRQGSLRLAKALDLTKDQSYFLYMLNQDQLSKLLFPLGDLNKSQVRELAGNFGLANAKKQDSQDVCFLEGRSYREFLAEHADQTQFSKGLIKTQDGKVIGEHEGLPFYTIGQRGKLGVAAGQRMYVLEKDAENNTLVIGAEDANLKPECTVRSVSWCSRAPEQALRASVKIRYRHPGAPAAIEPMGQDQVKVIFDIPQASVTPGQSAVFYDGEEILGGGLIHS